MLGEEVYEGGKWDEFYASTARSVQFFRVRAAVAVVAWWCTGPPISPLALLIKLSVVKN